MTDEPALWNLLRIAPCRACGRPAAEGCACGWCGEKAPVAAASHADVLLAGLGLMLLGLGDFHGPGADAMAAAHLAPLLSVLSALAGWAVVEPLCGTAPARPLAAPAAALAAGLAALTARLAPGPLWPAWTAPAAALAVLLLVPAPLPPVPAASRRGRLAQRFHAVFLFAAAVFATFAWSFAATGPTALSLLGFGAFLCALGRRMRRPGAFLAAAAALVAPLAADPSAFALGAVAAAAAAQARRGG